MAFVSVLIYIWLTLSWVLRLLLQFVAATEIDSLYTCQRPDLYHHTHYIDFKRLTTMAFETLLTKGDVYLLSHFITIFTHTLPVLHNIIKKALKIYEQLQFCVFFSQLLASFAHTLLVMLAHTKCCFFTINFANTHHC